MRTHFSIMVFLIFVLLGVTAIVLLFVVRKYGPRERRFFHRARKIAVPHFPQAKPAWVKPAVLELHVQLGLSHRKLADAFNRLYQASTGVSVGRTWVREMLMNHEYEILHLNKTLKHQVPVPVKRNAIWGIDTTCVTDTCLIQHHVLGMIDHGTRLNLLLHRIRRFNSWTFLGYLFLAIGNYGKPKAIKMDNHPVFRSKLVKQICTLAGIKLRFSAPGKPWQNGRIERFFGTLKNSLRNFVIQDGELLLQSIYQFQFWYNNARTHQHLAGRTPMDAWCGRDPFCNIPKVVEIHSLWHGALKGMVLRY